MYEFVLAAIILGGGFKNLPHESWYHWIHYGQNNIHVENPSEPAQVPSGSCETEAIETIKLIQYP